MAIDFSALRKKLGQLSGNNSKRRVFWRPEEGKEYAIRIIAFPDNDGNPFKERYFYYNIGNNPGLLSPYQFGKPDPIQELINKLREEGSKESYELAKKLYPKMRCYAPVIVRGEEDKGVRLWGYSKTVYENLLNLVLNPDYGDITDPENGTDLTINYGKKAGQMFPSTDIQPRRRSSALADDSSEARAWMESEIPYDSLFVTKTTEEVEEIFRKHREGVSSEEKEAVSSYKATSDDEVGSAFNELLAS